MERVLLGLKKINRTYLQELLRKEKTLHLVDEDPQLFDAIEEHPRIRRWILESPLQREFIAREIAWQAALRPLSVDYQPGWELMARQIEECHYAAHALIVSVQDRGITAFRNAKTNWKQNGPFRKFEALKDAFCDIPAIVCGAGPSLQQELRILKEWGDRALIIGAGTAGVMLGQEGITPHLMCWTDPHRVPAWIERGYHLQVPCCLQSHVKPEGVSQLRGEKILAPEGGALPWDLWWLDHLFKPSWGWTVGTFAVQTAFWMGCNPIILVGMDLCYRKNQKYAAHFPKQDEGIGIIEYRNKKTQSDFVLAAHFLEQLSREHPERKLIQTAIDGLVLQSPIQTASFASLHSDQKGDYSSRMQQWLGKKALWGIDLAEREERWLKSLERSLAIVRNQEALESEIVYEYYLKPLWDIWRPLFDRTRRENSDSHSLDEFRVAFFEQTLRELLQ